MSVKSELLDLVEYAAGTMEIPPVSRVYMPDPAPSPDRDAEFGVVVLQDGAAGLYYSWLGESQMDIIDRFSSRNFTGMPALELARYYESDREADCSLGLAAINAITRWVYRRAGFATAEAGNSLGALGFSPEDHVGMVGFFPSMVRRLREQRIRLTVIEKKEKFYETDDLIRVIPDQRELLQCNKILSTASTMLNNSIDEILRYTVNADHVVIIGPTAGFFPDPLFLRGVTAIGGSEIIDSGAALERLRRDERMGDAAHKYLLRREDYPGTRELLKRIR